MKNKKAVESVKYSIQPRSVAFSTSLPNKNAPLQNGSGGVKIVLNVSDLEKGSYNLFTAITIKNNKNPQLAFAVINFTKTVAAYYDGDAEPPVPPVPPADQGIPVAGNDIDGDFVRDDVEAYINSLNRTSLEREGLISFAKLLQQRTLVSTDEVSANDVSAKLSRYQYCLWSRFNTDELSGIMADIQIEQYNTKERLIEWKRTQNYLSGTKTEMDTNQSNWESYCAQ